ncbi:MAG: sulfatase, partial [Draconibacterium sp.]|nr:sulfatase [Draconibacterium sp.]
TTKESIPEQPNIVWITSEDNSKHYMKLFDENGVATPNIETLAEQGVIFTRAFSNAPVCSAARSTLISGCYGPRIASHYHRRLKRVPMPTGVEMYPAYLKKAGYYTTNNSKEDYNIIKADNVWDESSKNATWRNRAEGQPFFHIQNFTTTHESRLFFTDEDVMGKDTLTNRNDCFVFPTHPNTEVFRYTNARYRDKIITLDNQVGEVLAELEKDGLMDNTFVFYYADHGGVLPGSKGYIMEVGLHVPLVVYIPQKYKHLVNLEAGTQNNAFVSFIDFGATILNLAGIEIPEGIDGKPFLGKDVSNEELSQRNITYGYADRFDEKYDMVRSVRVDNFKYVRNYQPFNFDGLWNNYRYKQTGYREWYDLYKNGELNQAQAQFFKTKKPEALYDLENDPFETNNLATNPEFKEKLVEMRSELDTWIKGMPDLSFYPEHHLINNAFENPVAFGQIHKADINKYIEIANLELLDFDMAKTKIEAALNSDDAWERYWGIIACSCFEKEAVEFKPIITSLAKSDEELINRVRAAEFLGITKFADPTGLISDVIYESTDAVESLLILNTVVLLQDGYGYSFDISNDKLKEVVRNDSQVQRRLEYLKVI